MRATAIPRGVGVVGRAWKSRKPVVVTDVSAEPDHPFSEEAARDRIQGTVAVPAVHDGEVVAVIGFAGHEAIELTDRLRDSLVGIGGEIGEFLARHRGQLEPAELTMRELEILGLAAEGNSGPAIAAQLGISPTTVKTHFENAYEKLGVPDRAAAVAVAIRLGLIS
jgi:two-component system nitrate/nitrite response regulator NarL